MAHDFLGTFNASQFARLTDFVRKQIGDIDARLQHLEAEKLRIGVISSRFDGGSVVAYKGDPSESYIGKLLRAYQVLGGDPTFDLQVRQKNTQPLFLVRGDEGTPARTLSNGRVMGGESLSDSPSALLVQKLTGWMSEATQFKRERLERKIRCALDYSDQLDDEIAVLATIKKGKEVGGSAENTIEEIRLLIQDRNYRAIADDQGKDPNGLMSYAPYLGLEPGPARETTEYGRTLDGYVTPKEDDQG